MYWDAFWFLTRKSRIRNPITNSVLILLLKRANAKGKPKSIFYFTYPFSKKYSCRLNTQIKNSPIFDSLEVSFIASTAILSAILFRIIHISDQSDFGTYRAYMIVEVLQEYLYGIGIPIMVYGRQVKMRKFLWRELKDMFHGIGNSVRIRTKTRAKEEDEVDEKQQTSCVENLKMNPIEIPLEVMSNIRSRM